MGLHSAIGRGCESFYGREFVTEMMTGLRVAPLIHARPRTFIEILGLSGLPTAVHLGDQIIAFNVDIVLLYFCYVHKR
jgi:hypothetical protein